MKKLIYLTTLIVIQNLTFNLQNSFAQAPNDNIGSGNCLHFDGTNDYVNVNAIENDVINTTEGTVEAWVKLDNTTGVYSVFGIGTNEQSYFAVNFQQSNKLIFFLKTANVVRWKYATNNIISANEWHHIACVQDGIKPKIYVDGEQMAITLQQGNTSYDSYYLDDLLNSGNNCFIGANQHVSIVNYFDGHIDEVRVWDKALTQAEIKDNICQTLVGNEAGLVGYWNMNEGTGTTVTDLTSNGNDGALN